MNSNDSSVKTFLVVRHAITLILSGKLKLGGSQYTKRCAVALSAHAMSAVRRDDQIVHMILGRRGGTADQFFAAASKFLFGAETRSKQATYSGALRRIAQENLDCRAAAVMLESLGLTRFSAGATLGKSAAWRMTDNTRVNATQLVDLVARRSERIAKRNQPMETAFQNDSLVLIKATGEHLGSYLVTDDLGRIYAALKAARV